MDADVIDGRRPARLRLNFEERVLADLHVDETGLPLVVVDAECFREAHGLGVERDRFVEVRDVHPDVIQLDESLVRAFRALGRNRGQHDTHQQSGNKQHASTHRSVLSGPAKAGRYRVI